MLGTPNCHNNLPRLEGFDSPTHSTGRFQVPRCCNQQSSYFPLALTGILTRKKVAVLGKGAFGMILRNLPAALRL